MTATRLLKIALVGLGGLISNTAAQALNQPARTGTGGGPETTITAPHTAPTGRVMPRPRMVDTQTRGEAVPKPETQFKDSFLMKDICVGC
ncbi:hypothetical protein H0176_03600 [Methylorubrum populi]|uniref:Uncharacterized protein n=1 Tax=Methylorubrum rhodesianum TaxID=29427 RepID=A0ABU9ZIS7_9HYPH|nr:hypothetical protein [Methylorubrum rhodesianum]MBK3405455.1 hypothetical protein [Methylorubrum rhodesianum]MBY0139357.1 hypothetical protein [Methylorubrum populi]